MSLTDPLRSRKDLRLSLIPVATPCSQGVNLCWETDSPNVTRGQSRIETQASWGSV